MVFKNLSILVLWMKVKPQHYSSMSAIFDKKYQKRGAGLDTNSEPPAPGQ